MSSSVPVILRRSRRPRSMAAVSSSLQSSLSLTSSAASNNMSLTTMTRSLFNTSISTSRRSKLLHTNNSAAIRLRRHQQQQQQKHYYHGQQATSATAALFNRQLKPQPKHWASSVSSAASIRLSSRPAVAALSTTAAAVADASETGNYFSSTWLLTAAALTAATTVAATENQNITTTSNVAECEKQQQQLQQNEKQHNQQQNNQNNPLVKRMTTGSGPRNVMMHRMRSLKGRSLEDKYTVDWKTVLGEGAYGSVHPARLAATGEKVALKRISRRYTKSTGFKTETDALLRIYDNGGHPNISGLRDMYEDHNYYYLIMDLVPGGEMFEHLINFGAYSEADAARLMHEVASALAFLHGVGVTHADLKPENLLLSTKNRLDGTIKMIDFGCAVVEDDDYVHSGSNAAGSAGNPFSGALSAFGGGADKKKKGVQPTKSAASSGTTAYWPPERFLKGQTADNAMDMWAVGVILYIMLTGVHPFDIQGVSTDQEIEQRIQKDRCAPMDEDLVGHLSESAKDLIRKLMNPDPKKRLSAYEMLQHPWVRGETALTEKIEDSDKRLSRFQDLRYKLEAGMFAVLVSQSYENARLSEAKVVPGEREDSAVHILKRAFAVFDAEGKGFVTSDDLNRVTSERTGSTISSRDTKEFLSSHHQSMYSPSNEIALSLSEFSKLFSGLKQRHFPRGHYIFHAGERGDAMYFLCSGKVEIQTRKGQQVALLRSGDFFGEGSLMDPDNKRYTTAKCSTPVDVIEIRKADFERYMSSSPSLRKDLKIKWKARTLEYAKSLLRAQQQIKQRTYQKGDLVYQEGDLGTSMFRVADLDGGELEVLHNGQVVHRYVDGDTFGESSLLFKRPRSSTVRCASDFCRLDEMSGEDFLGVVESTPEMAKIMKDMCRKRLFKKAVKKYALERTQGLTDDDLVSAFNDADIDRTGLLNLEELTRLMRKMDPKFPKKEIKAILTYVDVDEDGKISLEEFKRLFRQFEDVKEKVVTSSAEKAAATPNTEPESVTPSSSYQGRTGFI